MWFPGKKRSASGVALMDFWGCQLQKGQAQRTLAKSRLAELPRQFNFQIMERLFLMISIKLRLRAFQ